MDANLPAAGAYNVTFGINSNVTAGVYCFTLTGVNQTNPWRSSWSFANLTNNAPTINGVSSLAGDFVFDCVFQIVLSGTLTPSGGQTWIGSQNSLGNGHAGASYRAGVGPSVNMVWGSGESTEWGMVSIAVAPYVEIRGRAVDYYVDVNDPDFQFRDAMGRIVPPWAIRSDTWGMLLGISMPSSQVVANFAQDQTGSYFYIEQVSYDDGNGQASIVCTRGDLDKVALARAAGQSTG